MLKMQRNQANVKEHKRQFSQQVFIRQQQRILKEEDVKKAQQRKRRIIVDKQDRLIMKELNHTNYMRTVIDLITILHFFNFNYAIYFYTKEFLILL